VQFQCEIALFTTFGARICALCAKSAALFSAFYGWKFIRKSCKNFLKVQKCTKVQFCTFYLAFALVAF